MRVHQSKRAKTCSFHEEECGGGKDWELWIQKNDKQQSPTVEHKKPYSTFSDKSSEK